MFPNVRVMIVAVVASIAALSCGFGIFAAFRVNHAPIARVASTGAPLQLVVGNSMPLSATVIAATIPTVYQAPPGPNPAASESLPARAEAPASSPPEQSAVLPQTAAAEDQPSPGREEPVHEQEAETEPSNAAPVLASSQAVSPQDAGQPPPPPHAKEETIAPSADELPTEPSPAAAPITAAVDPAAPPSQMAEDSQVASEPVTVITISEAKAPTNVVAKPPAKPLVKNAKKPARAHVAKTIHRSRRLRAVTFADSSSSAYLSAQTPFPTAPQFQTAPRTFQQQAGQAPFRARRIKISAKKATKKHSAIGGPFVGAPSP